MPRLTGLLLAVCFIGCASDRSARAAASDPTNPKAPVPAVGRVPDALAPVKLVPDDEDTEEPKAPHHHHGATGGGR